MKRLDGDTLTMARGESLRIFAPRWWELHRWAWWYLAKWWGRRPMGIVTLHSTEGSPLDVRVYGLQTSATKRRGRGWVL